MFRAIKILSGIVVIAGLTIAAYLGYKHIEEEDFNCCKCSRNCSSGD